jgi:probable O-glycosylation ligase (exosortase A-associated)
MNPHRMTWGIAYDFPFAQIVALALLAGTLFSKEKTSLPDSKIVKFWLVLLVWMAVTTLAAIYPEKAFTQLIKVYKIQLIVFVTLLLMNDEKRFKWMLWVVFLSVGYFGIKGGLFAIRTGGAFRVWGPDGSYIAENNALAVALLMILPIGLYLWKHEIRDKRLKLLMLGALLLIVLSVFASQSRGAFLSIIAVSGFLWLKTHSKIISGGAILVLLPFIFLSMPQSWHDRMSTIQDYEQDMSAMQRLNAWQYSINAANANPITGAGMQSWSPATFAIWAPDPTQYHAAHSIYFSMLADHGWIGLLMFIGIFVAGFVEAGRIRRDAKAHPDKEWVGYLAGMLQISLVAYGSGGAFLSLAYFDLPWHMLAMIVLLRQFLPKSEMARKPTL